MCYNDYGDNMKINIFDRAASIIWDKVNLIRPTKNNIVSSYYVHINESLTDTTYYYVRTEEGKEALYLCPGYKFIAGDNIFSKSELEAAPKKNYNNKQELTRNEITERFFFNLLNKYKQQRTHELYESKYQDGFNYIQSLYYKPNDSYLTGYNMLYNAVKKECDNLGIVYEMDPEKVMSKVIHRLMQNEETNYMDLTYCESRDAVDRYYAENIAPCKTSHELSYEVQTMQYLRTDYTMNFPGDFLTNSDNLICALLDSRYPNREEILKNYMEFFIAKDIAFDITTYFDHLISKADQHQMEMDKQRFNSNFKFMEELENLVEHDRENETYRYHATTSLEDAKRIIEEGFYSYSKDLDSTSFKEFSVEQILAYSYGNGFENFGDFIIVLSEPKGEDIVEELTEEQQEEVKIIPRRNAIIGNKPPYRVDSKHIVAIVDKKHEKVILNPEYINNSKKQINM